MCTNKNNIKNFPIEKLTKNWSFYIHHLLTPPLVVLEGDVRCHELKTDAKYTLNHIMYNTVICEGSRFHINPFLKKEEDENSTMTVWGEI